MRSVASFFRSCCKSDDAIECDKGAEKKAVKTHFASDLGGGVKVLNQKIPDVVVTPGPSALEGKMPHGCLVASELTPKQGSLNPFLFSNQARSTIRRIFTQRRKQIGSLAKRLAPTDQNKVLNWLEKSELSTTLRPEQIDPLAWRELAKLYRN